jgi:hypothetical protein
VRVISNNPGKLRAEGSRTRDYRTRVYRSKVFGAGR